MQDERGADPPDRRKAKPCRLCEERHWNVFEKTPESDDWYARVWHKSRVVKKKVGPHGLARKVAKKWEVQIAEGKFFPQALTPTDEPLKAAINAYLDRRSDLGDDWHRVADWWLAQPEVKASTTVRDFAVSLAAIEAIKKRRTATNAASTWNKAVAFLHAFYEDYEDRRRKSQPDAVPVQNPMKKMRATEQNVRVRFLTDDEEHRLLANLPDPVDQAIVLAALHSGARRGNIFAWEWTRDVRLETRRVRTWHYKGRTKGLHERWLPINGALLKLLRDLPSRLRSRWAFPNANGTGPMDPKNWYRRTFKPAAHAAAEGKTAEEKKTDPIYSFRFHDLRHTTASRLRQRGVPIEDVAEALGHADTRVTQRYAHIAPGRLDAVMELLVAPATDPRTDPSAVEANTASGTRSARA
jgi:integrase